MPQLGFDVLTAVSIDIAVFWDLTPCPLVDIFLRNPLPPFCAVKV
jgi:hypothetical protein